MQTYLKSSTNNQSLGAIIRLQHTLHVSTFAIRAPVRLFGIVRLKSILPFHLKGDHQVRTRIGIRLTGLSKLDVARHVR